MLPFDNRLVTFAQFMESCLYDPSDGYYTSGREVFGRAGDFYTSPYTHRFFAETVADACAAYLGRLARRPGEKLHLVEYGAGTRLLGEQLSQRLNAAHPDLAEQVEYLPIDIRYGSLPGRVRGVVFSNEFFDALPVHRVRIREGRIREIYLRLGDPIAEVEDDPSDPRIEEYMRAGFTDWVEGWEYEVNLRMLEVLERLDRSLGQGYLITIDYGFQQADYGRVPRAAGTIMSYYRHEPVPDPYLRPGEQDITAHVNFDMLIARAAELGWKSERLKSQRQFLMDWGLGERLLEEEQQGVLNAARIEQRLGLKALLLPGGISDTMKVLVQAVRTG